MNEKAFPPPVRLIREIFFGRKNPEKKTESDTIFFGGKTLSLITTNRAEND